MLSKEVQYRKNFASNLNYYMQINGKIQDDLIKDLGIKSSTLSSWCTGVKMPRVDKIEMLAKYFGIHFSDLVEERKSEKKSETISIPLFSSYKESYIYTMDHYHVKDLLVNDNIPLNSFGLIVNDNSMSPLLDKEDIAIIERNAQFVSGKIYLILNHNITIIRRITKTDNGYELQALNPYFPVETVNEINIIGKIIKAENKSAFK